MARGFGTTHGVGSTDIIQTGYTTHATQRTFAAWTYRSGDGGSGVGTIIDKSDTASEIWRNSNGGPTYQFIRTFSGGSGIWNISRAALNTWAHFAVTYDSGSTANDPVMYLDGVSQTVSEQAAPVGSPTNNALDYDIGNRSSDSSRAWDGILAEVAIWDAILDQPEIAILAKGGSPILVRPASLKVYRPLVRDTFDPITGVAGTIVGTAVQPHFIARRPSRRLNPVPDAAAAGAPKFLPEALYPPFGLGSGLGVGA